MQAVVIKHSHWCPEPFLHHQCRIDRSIRLYELTDRSRNELVRSFLQFPSDLNLAGKCGMII